jgi:histidine ammonia-lyase
MDNPIHIDGTSLTMEHVWAVAHWQPIQPHVRLTPQAQSAVSRAAQGVQTLLAQGKLAYGITTGFGATHPNVVAAVHAFAALIE